MKYNNNFKSLVKKYIFISVFPAIILGLVTIFVLFSKLAKDTKALNNNIIEQSQRMIDTEIQKLLNVSLQIASNDTIVDYIKDYEYKNDKNRYATYEVINELKRLHTNISVCDELLLLIEDDILISNLTVYSFKDYFERNIYTENSEKNAEEWLEDITQTGMKYAFLVSEDGEVVLGCRKLGLRTSSKDIYFITKINTGYLSSMFEETSMEGDIDVSILDRNENVIEISRSSDISRKEVLIYESKLFDFKYQVCVSDYDMNGNVGFIISVFVLLLIVIVLISLIAAKVQTTQLNDVMCAVFNEKQKLEVDLKEQIGIAKRKILYNLLVNASVNENDLTMLKTYYPFFQNAFTVMAISLGMKRDVEEICYNSDTIMLQIIELLNRELKGCHVNFEEIRIDTCRYVYVMEVLKPDQEKKIEKLPMKLKEAYDIQMYVGIGETVQDIHDIHEPYEEALSALRFGMIKQTDDIVYYTNIKNIEKSRIYYSRDKELMLVNEIKKGDETRVREIFEEIYQVNFCERCLSYIKLRILMQCIAHTILELIDDIYFEEQDEHERYLRSCYYLLKNVDSLECFHELYKICINLCKKGVSSDSGYELRERINEYIEQNYCNDELSLEMLSDHIGISYSYMSRSFKEYFGTNFKQYITEMRMKKACELLSEDKFTVKEVANMTGFCSSNSFIRLFKKYYGITPEKYAKQVNNRR